MTYELSAGRLGRRRSWLAAALAALRRRIEADRAIADLERLDDHLLRDMGLTRDGLRQSVSGGGRK